MLRDQINDALKVAMKSQEKRRTATLRLVNAAVKDRDIAARTGGKEARNASWFGAACKDDDLILEKGPRIIVPQSLLRLT